ncbi:hypothetical protein COP2_012842 [Malus domestica]
MPLHHARPQATKFAACDGPARFLARPTACMESLSMDPRSKKLIAQNPDTQKVLLPLHHHAVQPAAVLKPP